jgi:hypothetical protein
MALLSVSKLVQNVLVLSKNCSEKQESKTF